MCNENYDSFLTLLIMVNDSFSLTYYVIKFCLCDITNRITYDNCALLRKHFYIINNLFY